LFIFNKLVALLNANNFVAQPSESFSWPVRNCRNAVDT
jgi:hypothetical protein